jgi:pimeloyl-ACP methyl ester carboxylesterase
MTSTLVEAPTLFIEAANGITYAYRRFGKPAAVPLVFMQHFRGNLENWDPALEALDLHSVDLFGFSHGGFVAQEVALIRPALVRRLVLAGTGPKGAPGMHGWRQDIADHAREANIGGEDLLYIFFAHTEQSQAKGVEFLGRFLQRTEDRDPSSTLQTRDAQYDSVVEWGIPDHSALQRLEGIRQPTLVIQGSNDLMIPTKVSHLMAGLIPDARIKIYPDSAHAFLFQYPAEVAADVTAFFAAA